MTRARLHSLAFLATLSLASCEKPDAAPTDSALVGSRWMLQRIDTLPIAVSSYSETTKSYLEFVALGHCTVGLGPCNNFSGRYSLGSRPQQLSITPQIATRLGCPALEIETRYLDNLAQTTRYEILGEELRLYDAKQAGPRLVFQKAGE